ncbi:cation diffusion facilitator family transporter [Sporolactobacillus vineae]|uniref:cation diffusion facilitator family transporter n=1 Tax=Sporolactobacillus vineae TaxID=444463 RepID=UPI000289A36C|nr:cation diffusion facilitator family transporter [Sporolactobacillus vineae]
MTTNSVPEEEKMKRSEPGHQAHHHTGNQKALFLSFLLITLFMIVEFAGGLISHSLALLSDAGHMLSDSISLGLSFAALVAGLRLPANNRKTFGYRRFEILSALFNGVLLLVISAVILIEAIRRFSSPVQVAGTEMLVIAALGLIINLVVAWILGRGESKQNLNVRSAWLHVIGDLLGSVGAISAALMINLTGWQPADPIASILVSLIILRSGWQVSKSAINILMEGKPDELDVDEIREKIRAVHGVTNLHDLHIWTITSGFLSLSCHLKVADGVNRDEVLRQVEHILEPYQLEHSTIQIEGAAYSDCHSDCAHAARKPGKPDLKSTDPSL